MGDSVVSSIVSFAVNNLSRLLIDEVNLLSGGVKDDVISLRNDLRFMAAFLKNSEGKRSNELVREMVNQIREVVFQSEDAIDTYVVNVARHKSLNKLRRCFHSVGHVAMLHEVNAQIKAIKSTLEGIYRNKAIYGIDETDFKSGTTEQAGVEYLQRRRRDVEEKEVVGLVNESNVVIQKLTESDPNLNVVSIIGMGGLGKTTLAKKVYNKDEVKGMFSCCAWSYVSNDYIIRDLLLSLLKCLKPSIVEYATGTSNAPPEPEDVADSFLDEVVERSLVQVARRRSDGGVKTCRVHDLLREFCILESKENTFMEVCRELDTNKCNPRRMSLQYTTTQFLSTKKDQSHARTRSLLLFGEWIEVETKGWNQVRNNFKLARVLDMNQAALYSSPSELKTLIHIRYLKVEVYDFRIANDVLTSVCNLWNLETLYLWFCRHESRDDSFTVPAKLWKLKSLRHIYLKYGDIFYVGAPVSRMKIGETRVDNLQTLGYIYLDTRVANVLNKGMFPNLTKLTLYGRWEGMQEEELLGKALQCLNKLVTLKLIRIRETPLDPNVFPTSLTKITIRDFFHKDSRLIKTLGKLPNLQILKLFKGEIAEDANCAAGDFPQLQFLHVIGMVLFGRWKKEPGAMPHIQHCFGLKWDSE
ncbi:hypothetical protein PIB30_075754 [Stylosanthes scabra]|uniref:Uncharacterized protein n=1 Tax=Stylosanthes scabra TaxID=79078 RepID=A0ABU6XNE7_9FABA|nr:hypothetical protein [Stylosanthes scabra]